MKGLFRLLGGAAAVAAGAAALAVIARLVEKETEFAVPAEQTAEPAGLADGLDAAPEAVRQAAADPEAFAAADAPCGESGAAEPAQKAEAAGGQPAPEAETPACEPGGPNANPVLAGPAQAPRTPDGKFDPARIASPEDFGDWEDLGCQG